MKKRFMVVVMLGLMFAPAAFGGELSGSKLRQSDAFSGVKCAGMASSEKNLRGSSEADESHPVAHTETVARSGK